MDRDEAMRLLSSVDYGRIVFDLQALPAIRPVNHLVDAGTVIVRTRLTSAIGSAVSSGDGLVVAYEADDLDPLTQTGWSVVVTGRAHTVFDPESVARYERLLHPWVNHPDSVVAIAPTMVTGIRIVAARE
ncbi:pyridoxamine 5'-phosphate oxidase family protein [Mycobacterium cookii]|nr:pyridoxamine 5'-phosphate oxidase family protein [Mycobacterium cookii]MCV7328640.1 pyridoxamine 5'-phosphate oxidase family protein [Mycobacterium cookii]